MPPFAAMSPAVYPSMRMCASNRMGVVAPNAVAVDEGALPGTVRKVFDGGDRNDGIRSHSLSLPNALVGSF